MRTTITIDDALFASASKLVEEENVSLVVKKALEAMIAAEAKKRLARLGGTLPEFKVAARENRVKEDDE